MGGGVPLFLLSLRTLTIGSTIRRDFDTERVCGSCRPARQQSIMLTRVLFVFLLAVATSVNTQAQTSRPAAAAKRLKASPTISELVEQVRLAREALAFHPNERTAEAEKTSAAQLSRLLVTSARARYGRGAFDARLALELLQAGRKWTYPDTEYEELTSAVRLAAYPGPRLKLLFSEPTNCPGQSPQHGIASALAKAIGAMVALDPSGDADFTVRFTNLMCSSADSRDSVESINSTYVAGYNQVANPAFIQAQLAVSVAQREVDDADYRHSRALEPGASAWGEMSTAIALAQAQNKLEGAQQRLAITPPYLSRPVYQQYQYQQFEVVRTVRLEATVQVRGTSPGRAVAPEQVVTAVASDRGRGIMGVLPQDRSGANNHAAVLADIVQLARNAMPELTEKATVAAREVVIEYLFHLSQSSETSNSRIAAALYATDLSNGTAYGQYTGSVLAAADGALLRGEEAMKGFKLPSGLPGVSDGIGAETQHPDAGGNVIENALQAVVSIDTGSAAGTGFFVTSGCLVVTNEHVIRGADTIVLKTAAKKILVGIILAKDPHRDLALLGTNAKSCNRLELGTGTAPAVGQDVFAIGDPLGLTSTVTKGIISAFRTTDDGVHYLQIDAALNPGNSGGPLVARDGRVLGINTFGFKGAQGLNFAISAAELKTAFGRYFR